MKSSTRILLVDDYAIVREGLSAILNRQADMQVIAEASNGKEGFEAYRQYRPDIMLTDVSMPIMDGISATAALLAEFPDARVVIFSSEDETFQRAMRAGAKACLLKDAPSHELLATIRRVHQAD